MTESVEFHYTAFQGFRRLASGSLADVATRSKQVFDRGGAETVLIYDNATGQLIDVDYRGTVDEVRRRTAVTAPHAASDDGLPSPEAIAPRRPGRPSLGVVAREVTLLPRHWEWLNGQQGGASVTLRKLVEVARRSNASKDRVRASQENAYRFMTSIAGDLAGFEEATRALFVSNRERFNQLVEPWPVDVREYAKSLAAPALEAAAHESG